MAFLGDGIIRSAAQPVEVSALVAVESHRASERVEHLGRGVHITGLLQGRVPGDTHSGEQCDLFPAQTRSASPSAGHDAELTRGSTLARGTQKDSQLSPPARRAIRTVQALSTADA